MNIAVLGSGNQGNALCADLTFKGHKLNFFARTREGGQVSENFKAVMEIGGIHTTGGISGFARLNKVTTELDEAIKGVDLVILTVPSFGHKTYFDLLAPHLEDGQVLMMICGNLGSLEFHKDFSDVAKKVKIIETNWVFQDARQYSPGHVNINFSLNKCWVAAFPGEDTEEIIDLVKELYPSTVPVSNVLEVILLNSNPIRHPPSTILNASHQEYLREQLPWTPYRSGAVWDIYRDGWTKVVNRVSEEIDKERITLCKTLELTEMPELQKLYEDGRAVTPQGKQYTSLYEAMHSKFHRTPTIVPIMDVAHPLRYIYETIPYTFVPWASVAQMIGVPAPTMTSLIHIASLMFQRDFREEGRTVEKLGIAGMNAEELGRFLQTGVR